MKLLVEDNLRDAGAVADVDENELAQIATAMDPAEQHDVFFRVRCAQGAAEVSAFQISEGVKHLSPFAPIRDIRAIRVRRIYFARRRQDV
jgi:hypothetical protein